MEMYVYNTDYFKSSSELQNSIKNAVKNIFERISQYEQQGVAFDKVFNDDKLKYDQYGDFYTYKYSRNTLQLRVLYTYLIVNSVSVIVVVDFYVKKKNNKKYIKKFELIKDENPKLIYEKSNFVAKF